jgi:hypothetical protein
MIEMEDFMKDTTKEILNESLAALDAQRLPAWVVDRLAGEFGAKAEKQLRRLAEREITNKKIARIFADAGPGMEAGCRGETVVSPPAEQARSNEVRQGL